MEILRPTLLVNKSRVISNIIQMKLKVEKSNAEFRPHFKTHQSSEIGDVYHSFGINKITVSSLEMAEYFAGKGWKDILVAFPVNILEIELINKIAKKIKLGLLVESIDTIDYLDKNVTSNISIWIKIDTGYGRTGIASKNSVQIVEIAQKINDTKLLKFQGLLTHAGHTYIKSLEKKFEILNHAKSELIGLKNILQSHDFEDILLSYGDTPSLSIFDDFSEFDELRPGNFIFYDVTQLFIGSCNERQIAIAIACPVVAIHHERNSVLIYGGGVHFSKDFLIDEKKHYGYVVEKVEGGWNKINKNNYVSSISQEHGVVKFGNKEDLNKVKIGDILYIYPIHSCMAANLLKNNLLIQEW